MPATGWAEPSTLGRPATTSGSSPAGTLWAGFCERIGGSPAGRNGGEGVGGGPSGPTGAGKAGALPGCTPGGGLGGTGSGLTGPETGGLYIGPSWGIGSLRCASWMSLAWTYAFLGMRPLGHRDVVVGQQGALGFLEDDDRDVVQGLVLRFGRHGLGVLADRVEEPVDRDPAFLVIGPLGVQPLGGRGSQPGSRLELLVIGVDFQEVPGELVGSLVDHLLEERPLPQQGVLGVPACWPAAISCPAASGT